MDNDKRAFLALVRAGLWEKEGRLLPNGKVNFNEIMRLSEVQSVVGLVTAGFEHVTDVKVPQADLLEFIGSSLQIEQQNKEINDFVAKLTRRLNLSNILSLVVKGQGVAQSYERPLWRAAGDVDLLLSEDDYEKAKQVLFPIACDIEKEEQDTKHQALKISGFDVELHGKMPFALSRQADDEIDVVISKSLKEDGSSVWRVNDTDVLLPKPDNHIILVFTHYLHHFFIEGVGLRQICDWCRMLWTYRESLDLQLLEQRINRMGLMTEWKAFAALAVDYLGMPEEAMPFYEKSSSYSRKAKRVLGRILKSGNFGHNNDLSYRVNYTGLTYKFVSLIRRFWDFIGLTFIFPVDSPKFFVTYVLGKMK